MPVETSIIVRTLNEAKHLEKLLSGLREQSYGDWELVLVDSGSTDGTLAIAERHGARIYHISKEQFSYGRSLNLGCQQARGRYLVFASGHVWPVSNSWLRNLTKPFEDRAIGMVYGRQRGTNTNRLAELRDLSANYGPTSRILVDEPVGNNGNAAISRELWLKQPFDESLPGLEDIDWARKIQQQGFRVYYAADAAVYHVHEETLHQVYRRFWREAIAHQRIFPGSKFTAADFLKRLSAATFRDLLFCLSTPQHRSTGKLLQIPATRVSEFLGTYRGTRWYVKRSREAVHSLGQTNPRSVVIEATGRHGLREAPLPDLEPDQVLVRVAYAGVCPADMQLAAGRDGSAPGPTGVAYPLVPGHEFSGVVVSVGPLASRFKRGQKVVGRCARGAYSRYLKLDTASLQALPWDVPLKNAVLAEPLAACLRALRGAGFEAGQRACIMGAGPLGNLCAQLLRLKGLRVSVVDSDERRLNLLHKYDLDTHTEAASMSFDRCLLTSDFAATDGLQDQPSASVTRVACSGVTRHDHMADTSARLSSNGAAGDTDDWTEAIRLIRSGHINLRDHIAVTQPLEAYEQAWGEMASGKWLKVLLNASPELDGL